MIFTPLKLFLKILGLKTPWLKSVVMILDNPKSCSERVGGNTASRWDWRQERLMGTKVKQFGPLSPGVFYSSLSGMHYFVKVKDFKSRTTLYLQISLDEVQFKLFALGCWRLLLHRRFSHDFSQILPMHVSGKPIKMKVTIMFKKNLLKVKHFFPELTTGE